MGPMIVKLIETNKSSIYEIKSFPKEWIDESLSDIVWADYRNDLEDHAIAAGDSYVLLEYNLNLPTSSSGQMHQIRQILKDLTITIKYMDIYKNEQPILCRKLDWFGENTRKQQKYDLSNS